MRKMTLIALLLALMLMLSGCALVTVDEAKDNARVIVDVDGETVNKQTFISYAYGLINADSNMQMYYNYMGADYVYQYVSQEYVSDLVMKHQAAKQGFDKLTEEDLQEVEADAQAQYNSFLDSVAQTYLADSELTGDELRQEAAKYVEEHGIVTIRGLVSLEDFQNFLKAQKPVEKLRNSITDPITVSAEDVQKALDEANYRTVQHVLVQFADPDAVSAAKEALTNAQSAAAAAQSNVDNAAEGADLDALKAALETANQAVEEAQAALDELRKEAKEEADKVYELATAEDADFAALITEYNDDPGMASNPDGYVVYTGNTDYVTEFVDAAMALEKVGDVSAPVETTYGYHIIRFAQDASSDCDAMNSAREAKEHEMLHAAQDAALEAAYDEWESAANVKTYLDRLK